MVGRGGIYLAMFACFSFRIAASRTFGGNDPFPLRRRLQEDPAPLVVVQPTENESPEKESDVTSKPVAAELDPSDVTQSVVSEEPTRKEEDTEPTQEQAAEQNKEEEIKPEESSTENETDSNAEKFDTGSPQQSMCNDAAECDACKIKVEASLLCAWSGNQCIDVEESNAPLSAAEMCEQNEKEEELEETQQSNQEVPTPLENVENSPDPTIQQPSQQCNEALDCDTCRDKVNTSMLCSWNGSQCVDVTQAAVSSPADMCQETKEQATPQTNDPNGGNVSGTGGINMASSNTFSATEDDFDEDGSGFATFAFFFATGLIGGGVAWFRRLEKKKNGNGITSSISEFGVPKAGGKGFNDSETVPLASTDDDEEWGWEDNSQRQSGGDVELTGTKKEDDDLTRAFAMQSTSLPRNISSQAPKINKRSSPIVSRTNKKAPPLSNFPSTTNTTTKPSMPSLKITSLGKSSGVPKKPMKKKAADDDLFASMGLAAKPVFSQNKPKVESKSSVTRSKLSTLAAADLGNADWDDDGDLDDLLND